jgi:hypothetical protein
MANWTGEIMFKSDWQVHSERNAPTMIYDWQSHETQTWTLKGLSPNKLDEYDGHVKTPGWHLRLAGVRRCDGGRS